MSDSSNELKKKILTIQRSYASGFFVPIRITGILMRIYLNKQLKREMIVSKEEGNVHECLTKAYLSDKVGD